MACAAMAAQTLQQRHSTTNEADDEINTICKSKAYGLGNNAHFELGLSHQRDIQPTLVELPLSHLDSEEMRQICTGWDHTCVLTAQGGRVLCMGANEHHQLGNERCTDWRSTLVPVDLRHVHENGDTVTSIACGFKYTLLLTEQNHVYGFGYGAHGCIGVGTLDDVPIPVRVHGKNSGMDDVGIDRVYAGTHSMAIALNGSVFAWGSNLHMQLGLRTRAIVREPVLVANLVPDNLAVIDLSTQYNRTFIITSNHTLYAIGNNDHGALGNGTTGEKDHVVSISGPSQVVQVASGFGHTLALTREGHVFVTGQNNNGQLGTGSTQEIHTFKRISFPLHEQEQIAQVKAGVSSSMALSDMGRVFVFGANKDGLLGDNKQRELSTIPMRLPFSSGRRLIIDANLAARHVILMTGFRGDSCSSPICFDYPRDDDMACNARGTCEADDECRCSVDVGYGGRECKTPLCFGYLATDPRVCSGRGVCITPNICSDCARGYIGRNCEKHFCNMQAHDSPHVCSSRGKCISPDECVCNNGFSGTHCQYVRCHGQFSNETSVCNGNGNCVTVDFCSCRFGYIGRRCTIFWVPLVITGMVVLVISVAAVGFGGGFLAVYLYIRHKKRELDTKGFHLEEVEMEDTPSEI